MKVIDIDTLIFKGLVSAASVANDAIDNAVDALNRVSTHNDWGCKEKTAINEYAITNKNKIKKLQENSRGFLNVITQVSNEFETSENSILDMFSSVEILLSGALGISAATIINGRTHTGHNQMSDIVGVAQEIFTDDPVHTGYNHGSELFGDAVGTVRDLFANDSTCVGPIETPDYLKDIGVYYMGISTDSLGNYTANNIVKPISVCKFDDISLE